MGPFSVFWIPVRNQNKKEKKKWLRCFGLRRKKTFLSPWKFGLKGRREGENGLRLSSFSFPWSIALRLQSPTFLVCLMRNTKRMPGSVLEVSNLRLVFSSDGVAVGVVIRSVEVRRPYDLVKKAFRFQRVGACIVIGLSFRFCFQLQQSGFH